MRDLSDSPSFYLLMIVRFRDTLFNTEHVAVVMHDSVANAARVYLINQETFYIDNVDTNEFSTLAFALSLQPETKTSTEKELFD